MTTHQQNQRAIQEGQQGGPAQKNQAVQGATGAERDMNAPSGVQADDGLPPPQQQSHLNPEQMPKELQSGEKQTGEKSRDTAEQKISEEQRKESPTNPGQTGTPGGKGKQDAPQNQKR